MRGLICPWCGLAVTLRRDGTLSIHKSNERSLTGRSRLHCRGAREDPDRLSEADRDRLRKRWRDDGGWLRLDA